MWFDKCLENVYGDYGIIHNYVMLQGKKVNIYFLKNGQHLGAIGAILKDAEDAIKQS